MIEARDAADYNEASYEIDFAGLCDGVTTPDDEPLNSYRVASVRLMRTLNTFIDFFYMHGMRDKVCLWGVAYAIGHPLTAGMSMLEAARQLGCTKQAISKVACDFLRETGLPPSHALKSDRAKATYRKTNGRRKK